MKILVTGANGQLGQEVNEFAPSYPDWTFIFTNKEQLNITDKENLEKFFSENQVDVIINCAAYTAVDKAEESKELAEKVNADGAKYIAEIANRMSIRLFHISTDYVFDGQHFRPYHEEDVTNPISVYGSTKLRGENYVLNACPDSYIIRTSSVYSSFGHNFCRTMLSLGKERDELSVVFDQTMTPTYASDIAAVILDMLRQLDRGISTHQPGIYHFANEGVASWYDFAIAIMELSQLNCRINPIETAEYPTPASRPPYSVLNKKKIKDNFGIKIPHWRSSLKECLKKLNFAQANT